MSIKIVLLTRSAVGRLRDGQTILRPGVSDAAGVAVSSQHDDQGFVLDPHRRVLGRLVENGSIWSEEFTLKTTLL